MIFTAQTQGGVQPLKWAFYVTGGGKVWHSVVYSNVNAFSYTPTEAGSYSVRAYAIDSTGQKVVFVKTFAVG